MVNYVDHFFNKKKRMQSLKSFIVSESKEKDIFGHEIKNVETSELDLVESINEAVKNKQKINVKFGNNPKDYEAIVFGKSVEWKGREVVVASYEKDGSKRTGIFDYKTGQLIGAFTIYQAKQKDNESNVKKELSYMSSMSNDEFNNTLDKEPIINK